MDSSMRFIEVVKFLNHNESEIETERLKKMNFGGAFLAGVVGGAVMTAMMATGRLTGMTEMNMEMALGSMVTQALGAGTWLLGLVMHLTLSGLIACLYAVGFEYVTRRAGWPVGVGFSVIHLIIGGLVMGMMGSFHPLMVNAPPPAPPGHLAAPGLFATNYGAMTTAAFVVLHLIFGAVVGAMYPAVRGRS